MRAKIVKVELECMDCGEDREVSITAPEDVGIEKMDLTVNCPECECREMVVVRTENIGFITIDDY